MSAEVKQNPLSLRGRGFRMVNDMKPPAKLLLISTLTVVGLSPFATAAPTLYESFSGYTTASLSGQATSGTCLTGNWDQGSTVLAPFVNFNGVSTGLTYAQGANQLVVSGGGMTSFRTSSSQAGKGIQLAPTSFDTSLPDEVWLSVLVDYSGSPQTGSAMLGVTINNSSTLLGGQRAFGIGITGGNAGGVQGMDGLQLNLGSGSVAAEDTGLSLSTGVNLIVARIRDSSNPNTFTDDMTVWVNPTLGVEPVGGGDTLFLTDGWVASNSEWGVNSVFASHNFATGSSTQMDELRYGNTYADVTPFTTIPEPSSLLPLGGAASTLLVVRLRKRF